MTASPTNVQSISTGTDFLSRFESLVTSDPERLALVHCANTKSFERITYSDLMAKISPVQQALSESIQSGTLFFIIHENPLEQIVFWLAAVRSGLVPGLLTPPTAKLPQAKYVKDLEDTLLAYPQASILYGDDIFVEAPSDDRFFSTSRMLAGGQVRRDTALSKTTMPDKTPAFVFQQSSGTTGLRKGVLLSERAVVNQLEAYGRAIGISDDDIIVSWLPLYHDMGFVACFLGSLFWGIPLVVASPFTWLRQPGFLFQAIEAHRGTLCWLPNFAFNVMTERVDPAKFTRESLTKLRLVVNCSEPVLPRSLARFEEKFLPIGLATGVVSSSYAMAENVFAVTQTRIDQPVAIEAVDGVALDTSSQAIVNPGGRLFASSGSLISGTELRIVEFGEPLPDGHVGVIEISGDSLMSGYFGVGGDSQVIDDSGWFSTGDLGYLREGELYVIGRAKDVIIRGGRNIDPARLEAAANEVDGVKAGRTAAFAMPNEDEGTEDIVIVAEIDGSGSDRDFTRIRQAIVLGCQIEANVAPQVIKLVEAGWLVKSSSGKISRAHCRAKYLSTFFQGTEQ